MRAELDAHPSLIAAVLSYAQLLRGSVEQYKAIVQLVDGT